MSFIHPQHEHGRPSGAGVPARGAGTEARRHHFPSSCKAVLVLGMDQTLASYLSMHTEPAFTASALHFAGSPGQPAQAGAAAASSTPLAAKRYDPMTIASSSFFIDPLFPRGPLFACR